IEDNPAIDLRTHTQIIALEGNGHLERVRWRDDRRGDIETNDIRHVFMMTGAVPNTGWLARCLALDDKGFIKTGPDLSQNDLALAGWPLTRPPYLLETSRPGVFAVGDVRGGNIKRVASAVGEGSIAVAFVHQVLQQTRSHRCCGKSLIGTELVGFAVRQHAQAESIFQACFNTR